MDIKDRVLGFTYPLDTELSRDTWRNDGFLLNTLKIHFRQSRVLLNLLKCILRGAKKA